MKEDLKGKLLAISLIDGRNRDKLLFLSDYFSEFALIKYRILVEIKYLLFLAENTRLFPALSKSERNKIQDISRKFDLKDAIKVKEIENRINHDVKACEYYIAEKLRRMKLEKLTPFVHFGLTSYDINTPAYGLILKDFNKKILSPFLINLLTNLKKIILQSKDMEMLGRTHGQPALPTTMGKELAVFYRRLKKEKLTLDIFQFEGKLSGAVGNLNALAFVSPEYNWLKLSSKFVSSLGLEPNPVTTQIMPYDNWLTFFDSIRRINSIFINLCQDIWWYISFNYFVQLNIEAEIGSSTMSQKINPITFENAEGNLGLANSLFEFFSRKLPVSRLQRDLTDSTVKRDFGLAFGFTMLAWDSLKSGFLRISPAAKQMKKDLNEHWEVFSEGVQTFLRKKGNLKAFEMLKEATRGKSFNKEEFYKLIDKLPLLESDKKKLKIKDLKDYQGLTKDIIRIALR